LRTYPGAWDLFGEDAEDVLRKEDEILFVVYLDLLSSPTVKQYHITNTNASWQQCAGASSSTWAYSNNNTLVGHRHSGIWDVEATLSGLFYLGNLDDYLIV